MATEERGRTLSIEYCGTCNYRPVAARLALAIKAATGLTAQLVHSHASGAFEVSFDGETIFSRKQTGRFPDQAAVVAEIKRRAGGPP